MSLVTVKQVNEALRLGIDVDGVPDDRYDDLLIKIAQAEDIVLDYITVVEKLEWDVSDNNVPPRVAAAVTLTVRALLDDSPDGSSAAWLSGLAGASSQVSTNPIAALLKRLRMPSLA